jgi:hypothetical protein
MGVERERESGMGWGRLGEQGQYQESNQSESQHQMLGKMSFTKKAHEKISCPRAEFNGRLKLPGWPGKDGTAQILGQAWLL